MIYRIRPKIYLSARPPPTVKTFIKSLCIAGPFCMLGPNHILGLENKSQLFQQSFDRQNYF